MKEKQEATDGIDAHQVVPTDVLERDQAAREEVAGENEVKRDAAERGVDAAITGVDIPSGRNK
jgi:hypothetical protein